MLLGIGAGVEEWIFTFLYIELVSGYIWQFWVWILDTTLPDPSMRTKDNQIYWIIGWSSVFLVTAIHWWGIWRRGRREMGRKRREGGYMNKLDAEWRLKIWVIIVTSMNWHGIRINISTIGFEIIWNIGHIDRDTLVWVKPTRISPEHVPLLPVQTNQFSRY